MDYLINEEELKELIKGYNTFPYPELSTRKYVDDFLKSKKSIKLIAEGRIYYLEEEIDIGVGNMEHLEYGFNGLTPEIAKENESCPAKLFIEGE